jgi:hypothetical protein
MRFQLSPEGHQASSWWDFDILFFDTQRLLLEWKPAAAPVAALGATENGCCCFCHGYGKRLCFCFCFCCLFNGHRCGCCCYCYDQRLLLLLLAWMLVTATGAAASLATDPMALENRP